MNDIRCLTDKKNSKIMVEFIINNIEIMIVFIICQNDTFLPYIIKDMMYS